MLPICQLMSAHINYSTPYFRTGSILISLPLASVASDLPAVSEVSVYWPFDVVLRVVSWRCAPMISFAPQPLSPFNQKQVFHDMDRPIVEVSASPKGIVRQIDDFNPAQPLKHHAHLLWGDKALVIEGHQ